MLTSGGPDNGRLPTPPTAPRSPTASTRGCSPCSPAQRRGRQLAGLTAAWFFGANAAGAPTYDPATGVTVDGVAPDGTVNRNSGAESTIHGLLPMLALDAHPAAAKVAQVAARHRFRSASPRSSQQQMQLESADSCDRISINVDLDGSTQYSRLRLRPSLAQGHAAKQSLPGSTRSTLLVQIIDLTGAAAGVATSYAADGTDLGSINRTVTSVPTGASPGARRLLPVTLDRTLLPRATSTVSAWVLAARRSTPWCVQPCFAPAGPGRLRQQAHLLRSTATTEQHTTVRGPRHPEPRHRVDVKRDTAGCSPAPPHHRHDFSS